MGGREKRIFGTLFVAVFSAMLGLGIVAPLLPIYAEELGASGLWIGLIFSGFSISRTIFMPLVGRISDRYGKRKFLLFGLALYTLISLAYTIADSVYSLTAIRFVHGFASAMVIPLAMAYVGEISPEGEEGKHMGTFMVSLFLGMGLGPFAGGILKDTLGINAAFFAMAALSLFSFLVCLAMLPESKKGLPKRSFGSILRNKVIRALLVFRTFNALGMAAMMAFLPIFAARIGLSSTEIGIALAANVLTAGFLQSVFGKIADRVDKVMMVVAGSITYAAGLAAIPELSNFFQVLAVSLIVGIGGAVSMPAATAMVVVEGRELGQGAVMGVFNMAMSVGVVVSPLLAGVVMDIFGINEVFYFSSILSAVGIAVFWALIRVGS